MTLATKTITVRVDEDTKKKAEILLDEIGINMTTLFNACIKALVREQRIPFSLVSNEYTINEMIREKLLESQAVASDPNAKRNTHDEIFNPLREKYGYAIQS